MAVPFIPLNINQTLAADLKADVREIRKRLGELKEHRAAINAMLTGASNDPASYAVVAVHYGCATNADAQTLRTALSDAITGIQPSLTDLITALR